MSLTCVFRLVVGDQSDPDVVLANAVVPVLAAAENATGIVVTPLAFRVDSVWGGKNPGACECVVVELSVNPIRADQDQLLDVATRLRAVLAMRYRQEFIPMTKTQVMSYGM